MKNKLLKGFTLIELIIVMAILSILMVGIMQMMKPIRETYVDSTYYESQRNTQSGIVTYLTESLRFATKMGVYNEQESGISNLSDAITAFTNATGYNSATDGDLNVITIDNKKQYKYNNTVSYGRILRSKDSSGTTSRLALGEAYYDKYTYSINVVPTGAVEKHDDASNPSKVTGRTFTGLKVTVSSLLPSSLNSTKRSGTTVKTNDVSGYKCVSTDGEVNCLNLNSPISGATDALYAGSSTTANSANTYIIFTLPKN